MFCPFAGAALGEVQKDLNFVGFSIGNNGAFPTYFAIDGTVKKATTTPDVYTGTQTIYFYWDWPYLVDEVSISATYMIAGDYRIVSGAWYGASMTGWNSCELTYLGSAVMASGKHDKTSTQNSVYQKILAGPYMYLVLAVTPDSSSENKLYRSYTYNFAANVTTNATNATEYLYTYNTSDPIWQYYGQYGTIYNRSEGTVFARGVLGVPSISGRMTGSMTTNSSTDVMASAFAAVTYGDDSGLQASIDDQTQVIQKEQDETQQTIKDETEKQTSAIGGFFDKLLGGIKDFFTGLFIPDEIATDAFTDLLERKLGFIYQVPAIVVSFFITLFGAFASGQASSITFPGWSYGEWTFLEPATISRSDYSAIFGVLDPILTIVGTILVVFAFCKGVQSFYERIIGGGKE